MMPRKLTFALPVLLLLSACNEQRDIPPEPINMPDEPETYVFERNGNSTVDFSGQTTRIRMTHELLDILIDPNTNSELAIQMFRNEGVGGSDVDPFSDPDLNASTKSIRSKVAASRDLFSSNTVKSQEIRASIEEWIHAQYNISFSNQDSLAKPGQAGQIVDGSKTRYIGPTGLEYDQLVAKTLIGALMTDQILNNYLSTSVLDEGTNRADNDAAIIVEGKNYTNMEHKWDEAYGYIFGNAPSAAEPLLTMGSDDRFLNSYTAKVDADEDFKGISEQLFNAFKLGRACIADGTDFYSLRDKQIADLRQLISQVIATRAVHYLLQGADVIDNGNMGPAFHALSEGYGFINSLRFTREPNNISPYFSHQEVDQMLNDLMSDGPNGLWDVEIATLHALADQIAGRFGFNKSQAAN